MSGERSATLGDPGRSAAVRPLGIIAANETFDRLVGLAALLLEAPLAFVTFVDDRRSWYRCSVGLPAGAERSMPAQGSCSRYVVDTGDALLVDDASADPRAFADAHIASLGVTAWAGFPIYASSGEVLGAFGVADMTPRSWTERDTQILGALARSVSSEIALQAALTGERTARAHAEAAADEAEAAANASTTLASSLLESRDHLAAITRTLQQSLLPPHLPQLPGLNVAAYFVPAATGEDVVGDFYDVFENGRGDWSVLLGDVSGKGPDAAAVTAMARWTLRAAAVRSERPSTVLTDLNAAMLHQRADDDERFLTVAYASLRFLPGKLALSVCSAGHLPPLIRRAGGLVEPACSPGLPLGLFDEPDLVDARMELVPGDAIVFYSDGVTEARRMGDEFGGERLRAVVQDAPPGDAADLVRHIEDAVTNFRQGAPRDDTAVLVLLVPVA